MSLVPQTSGAVPELLSRKRFKITSVSRNEKIGLVASCVSEVLAKGAAKLQAGQTTSGDTKLVKNDSNPVTEAETPPALSYCKVVLEEDGTEVDEDDYLQALAEDTLLMLLKDQESWQGCIQDEIDAACQGLPKGLVLLNRIMDQPNVVFSMKEDDIEEAASYEFEPALLHGKHSAKEVEEVQEACLRFLKDKRDAQDALGLLKLLRKTQMNPDLTHATS